MGADLYIRKVTDAARAEWDSKFEAAVTKRDALRTGPSPTPEQKAEYEAAQAEVSRCYDAMHPETGYFRDSYNATSVMWTLGLSWWKDVIPMLSKSRSLRGKKLLALVEMIESAKQKLPTKKELVKNHATVDAGENSIESWHKSYVEGRASLIAFLRRAVETKQPVEFSL